MDKTVVFYPLGEKSLRKIVDLQVEELIQRLSAKKFYLSIPKNVRDFIMKESFTPEFGARPIRKFIADKIETIITDAFLDDRTSKSGNISLILKEGKIVLR